MSLASSGFYGFDIAHAPEENGFLNFSPHPKVKGEVLAIYLKAHIAVRKAWLEKSFEPELYKNPSQLMLIWADEASEFMKEVIGEVLGEENSAAKTAMFEADRDLTMFQISLREGVKKEKAAAEAESKKLKRRRSSDEGSEQPSKVRKDSNLTEAMSYRGV